MSALVEGLVTLARANEQVATLTAELELTRAVARAAVPLRGGCVCSPLSGCQLATLRAELDALDRWRSDQADVRGEPSAVTKGKP